MCINPFRAAFSSYSEKKVIAKYLQTKIKDVKKMAAYGRNGWDAVKIFKKLKTKAIGEYGAKFIA